MVRYTGPTMMSVLWASDNQGVSIPVFLNMYASDTILFIIESEFALFIPFDRHRLGLFSISSDEIAILTCAKLQIR